ncbi:prepilin-type N-terminal cleavage/methylation domain-containing protein [Variovorax paradoxus]|uniref:Type IV pilus assembly protein PilE n=1 Tax=Variovorax paradoxus TaxID=34073 RepID=A0AAW8EDR7_VARPD|nr:type IV pilin protein [Variovorax paradoxus]MDP9970615.1 type IV pilus assembly protein PilE [Variovorax paradoxus]
MKQQSARRPASHARMASMGFTLIEVMVTVAIVAILASIAYPSYTDYLRRGSVQEAVGNLSDYRAQMEQFYQDNRNYGTGTTCGITLPSTTRNFTYSCAPGTPPQTYTATATGRTGTSVAGFAYTIDQRNSQGTTCTNCAWGFSNSTSWILRKP